MVCDSGATATGSPDCPAPVPPGAPGAAQPAPPVHPATRQPVSGTASAAPAARPRGRRRWAVPLTVIAIAAALGLTAGLVIWAPWKSAPLVRPAGLTPGPSTTRSVAFGWSPPATGPAPDRYLILRGGAVIASVPGTVTSYRQAGLAPATAYQYQVAAVRGGKRSARSAVLVVRTATPPVSAARLQGPWTVRIKVVRGAADLAGGSRWDESWTTSPKCAAGACAVRLSGQLNGHTYTTTLTRTGGVYRGKIAGNLFPCGSGAHSFPVRSTVTFRVKVTAAHADNQAWAASSWTGTMVAAAPYTSTGAYYCPASRMTASLSGRP
jgi:hypothetical protein